MPYSINAGFNAFDGHFDMHRWQELQYFFRRSALDEPGGVMAVWRVFGDMGVLRSNKGVLQYAPTGIIKLANKNFLLDLSFGGAFAGVG
jgi:hypothetical protein